MRGWLSEAKGVGRGRRGRRQGHGEGGKAQRKGRQKAGQKAMQAGGPRQGRKGKAEGCGEGGKTAGKRLASLLIQTGRKLVRPREATEHYSKEQTKTGSWGTKALNGLPEQRAISRQKELLF